MSEPTDLLALAERVEGASGPDRELDAEIFRSIGAPVPFQFANRLVALTFDRERQAYFAPVGDMQVRYEPPAYSASLDAAMTLVPTDGSMKLVEVSWSWEPKEPAVWPAAVIRWYPPHMSGPNWHCEIASAATLPLTICLAALRVRARAQTPSTASAEGE